MNPGRLLIVALVAASISVGCQSLSFLPSTSSTEDRIDLRNDTTTDVTVRVNGGLVGTVGAGQRVELPIVGYGGPPFRIEALSLSGAVLFEWLISASDYQAVRDGQASMSTGADPGCGWIEARYGDPADMPEAPVGVQPPGGVCP